MNKIEVAYGRFCKKRFPLPSESVVAALEDRLGVRFPGDYRSFLLKYNEGYFSEPQISPTPNGCPESYLDLMNGIGASHSSAELGNDVNLFDENDPPQILPIGYTLGNHLIFMVTDPTDEMPGMIGVKIAFRDHSYWLADNIEDFFALLKPE